MQITTLIPARTISYHRIKLQALADYMALYQAERSTHKPPLWRVVVTDSFNRYYGQALYELQLQLQTRFLPTVQIDIIPGNAFENPMPPDWPITVKDRTLWVYRGAREIGYITL